MTDRYRLQYGILLMVLTSATLGYLTLLPPSHLSVAPVDSIAFPNSEQNFTFQVQWPCNASMLQRLQTLYAKNNVSLLTNWKVGCHGDETLPPATADNVLSQSIWFDIVWIPILCVGGGAIAWAAGKRAWLELCWLFSLLVLICFWLTWYRWTTLPAVHQCLPRQIPFPFILQHNGLVSLPFLFHNAISINASDTNTYQDCTLSSNHVEQENTEIMRVVPLLASDVVLNSIRNAKLNMVILLLMSCLINVYLSCCCNLCCCRKLTLWHTNVCGVGFPIPLSDREDMSRGMYEQLR